MNISERNFQIDRIHRILMNSNFGFSIGTLNNSENTLHISFSDSIDNIDSEKIIDSQRKRKENV